MDYPDGETESRGVGRRGGKEGGRVHPPAQRQRPRGRVQPMATALIVRPLAVETAVGVDPVEVAHT